ncbi:MAG: sigma-70 family RNA polymerase sigma factor [Candidatus Eisenbacteria bacterium]|uniref:Sigma-70 family RNA polymerase sigma factor n=1 Tax=Eiseniibacteriota bacterium TaxID=2212470 RepID=A0A937XDL5_UNCEI|nr:sigma-70 family RNA polymerase sigma factor [Candidatus Eisenbacteria bacterium]
MDTDRAGVMPQAIDEREQALIRRCQAGDREAFAPLVVRYRSRAASFALAWTGSTEDALDLSQEAFARAFRAIRRFDPARPFYPWLHRILKNLCLNHLGRAFRLREVPLIDAGEQADDAGAPDRGLEREEACRQVWEGIRRLGPRDREILILREFQHLTYAEAAVVLGIPRGTVMSRLHQARLRLRRELDPYMAGARGGRG